MISKWQWLVLQLTRKLWVRAGLFAVLAIATALAAIVADNVIPWQVPGKVGADAVDRILDILASSMLSVTTFSLSVMVAAYGSATTSVTPRATKLLMQDTTTQNVLATFIGSFLFSLVGIVALSTGAYGERGRVLLFIVTMVVIALIVVTILRWIDHLSRLGRVGETTARVEVVTAQAVAARVEHPYLGGRPLENVERDVPADALPIFSEKIGYVQHVDMGGLSKVAEDEKAKIFMAALPGAYVHPARPLAFVAASISVDAEKSIRGFFNIGDERSFDQDPRFGLSVLAEIASRALSPAVNDPGTAIDVIGRAVRVLALWKDRREIVAEKDFLYPLVFVPPIRLEDMFDDVFTPVARDGAGNIAVQVRLQKALWALAQLGGDDFGESARLHARLALRRGQAALTLDEEKAQLKALAGWAEP